MVITTLQVGLVFFLMYAYPLYFRDLSDNRLNLRYSDAELLNTGSLIATYTAKSKTIQVDVHIHCHSLLDADFISIRLNSFCLFNQNANNVHCGAQQPIPVNGIHSMKTTTVIRFLGSKCCVNVESLKSLTGLSFLQNIKYYKTNTANETTKKCLND